MDRETLRAADVLLLRCGARATALQHPNQEHPPKASETELSRHQLRLDLEALRAALPAWIQSLSDDLHARENG